MFHFLYSLHLIFLCYSEARGNPNTALFMAKQKIKVCFIPFNVLSFVLFLFSSFFFHVFCILTPFLHSFLLVSFTVVALQSFSLSLLFYLPILSFNHCLFSCTWLCFLFTTDSLFNYITLFFNLSVVSASLAFLNFSF